MTDFKGSMIQTHFWVLPTKQGLQPLGLTLQTDPRWFLHINSPATHLGKFIGGGIVLSRSLVSIKGKRRGSTLAPLIPLLPQSKPHTVNTAAGRLKTFHCLMTNRVAGHGQFKIKYNS